MVNGFWSVACVAGLWAFVGCTVVFILKGFRARGVFDVRASLPWGVALLVSFLFWMIGMANG
ncbi:hypothetical protein GMSM_31720 [Geomonas sp. Red276]